MLDSRIPDRTSWVVLVKIVVVNPRSPISEVTMTVVGTVWVKGLRILGWVDGSGDNNDDRGFVRRSSGF